jgi:hypothetical protein
MKIKKGAREVSFGWFGPIIASLRAARKKRAHKLSCELKNKK